MSEHPAHPVHQADRTNPTHLADPAHLANPAHPAGTPGDQVPALVMPDEEFLSVFERGGFPGNAFPHRAHLRMAWLYVTTVGPDEAIEKAATGIRNIAQHSGLPTLYHDTITRAWVYAVAAAIRHSPSTTFDGFIEAHPLLLDKRLLLEHYTAALLTSPEARARWVAPDVRAIPGAPPDSL